jgi:hypothetical protein
MRAMQKTVTTFILEYTENNFCQIFVRKHLRITISCVMQIETEAIFKAELD